MEFGIYAQGVAEGEAVIEGGSGEDTKLWSIEEGRKRKLFVTRA